MTGTEFPAEIHEGELIPAGDTPSPKINLHDLEAIRREMGRVYRDARSGVIEAQEATRLTFVLAKIADLHQIIDVDKRLKSMERVLKGRI